MTPQERDLILGVAQRLRGTRLTEKDFEAERLIQTEIGSQPDALYLLTQAVIVQEQGLRHAQERIQQLEAQLQVAQQQPHQGGFLSSLFGGGSAPAPAPAPPPPSPAPPPEYGAPAGGSAAGSFLRSAAATAAGVVGGELIFDGLRHMFGGGSGFMPGTGGSFLGGPPVVEENVTNIYENNPGPDQGSFGGGGSWGDDNTPDDTTNTDDQTGDDSDSDDDDGDDDDSGDDSF